MARRVAVVLDLDAEKYISGGARAAAATHALDSELKGLDRETTGAKARMDELAVSTSTATREVDNLGSKARKTVSEMDLLDRRISVVQRSVRSLGVEFAATGDAATGAKFNKQKGLLAELEKLKESLAGLGNDQQSDFISKLLPDPEPAGKSWGSQLMSGIAHGFSGISRREIIMALVGVVIAAAPFIGAALSGALAGAMVTGVIALGVVSAIKDPVVKSALGDFGGEIKRMFFGAGSSFIEPIRQSLGILRDAFENLQLDKVFAKVAPLLTAVATGFALFFDKMMPGINRALDRAGPLVEAMSIGFGKIGDSIGYFFDRITASKGTLLGLQNLFGMISHTVIGIGNTLGWLADRYEWLTRGARRVVEEKLKEAGVWDAYQEALKLQIPTVEDMGDAMAGAAEQANYLTNRIKGLTDATEGYINAALDVWSANIDAAQAMADLEDKLVKGKKNWDLNTQAGRDNQKQLEQTITALDRKRQADIANSDGSIDAINKINAEYDKQLLKVLGIASAAGAAKTELDKLAKTYTVKVILDLRELNQLNKADAVDKAMGISGARAGGGPMGPGNWLVGEYRPEVVTVAPGTSAYAYPSVQQWQQMSTTQAWGQLSSAGGESIDYGRLGAAVAAALTGTAVTMDGHAVGELVSAHQADNATARPRI